MKLNPPSSKALRILSAVVAISSAWMAISDGPSWSGMFNASVAGFGMSGIVYWTWTIRMQASFDEMRKLFEKSHAMNKDLIATIERSDLLDQLLDRQETVNKQRLH